MKSSIAPALACLLFSLSATANTPNEWQRPERPPAPADNQPTSVRVELGRSLFFDPRLSAKGVMSCASCHNPALGWSDGRATAMGQDRKILARATPTIINAAFNPLQMWDGRKTSLEDQALGPFESPDEQNLALPELERRVRSISGYVEMFARAYPDEGVNSSTIAKAIASFERTVVSKDAPFDRWVAGERNAISPAARRGFELFQGKAKCVLCHQGFNFTDNGFHNIGLKETGDTPDLGRFARRKVAVLKGAFKTPTLREITLTAPYMHNGAYTSLEQVIDHYDRGGDSKSNLDANMQPLHLNALEKADLLEFLHTLTSRQHAVVTPVLPQ